MRHAEPSRLRRLRQAPGASAALPSLDAAQTRWLRQALALGARVKHATLLKAGGHRGAEMCHAMLEWLVERGWLHIEDVRPRLAAPWQPLWVQWRDWEAACRALGVSTPSSRQLRVEALAAAAWTNPEVGALAQEVASRASAVLAPTRMDLLRRLDAWSQDRKQGTWRDFSLYARGDTKLVNGAERAWLERQLDTRALGIESHVPLVLVAGPLRLEGSTRIESVPAMPVGLPPALWTGLTAAAWCGAERFAGYVVVENRTNFDRLVASDSDKRVVLWCPGYPPVYWREAIQSLLRLLPADALVFCDPDPAGIDIACRIGELWQSAQATWTPWHMGPEALSEAGARKLLTEADRRLLDRLLQGPLPRTLSALAGAMQASGYKAEQEGLGYTA